MSRNPLTSPDVKKVKDRIKKFVAMRIEAEKDRITSLKEIVKNTTINYSTATTWLRAEQARQYKLRKK